MSAQSLQALMKRPGYRYLIVGGTVYAVELLIIVIAQKLGATPVWAVAIAYCSGTTLSFFMQKFVTFGDRRMHHKILVPQMVATALLVLWNLGFSVLLTKLLENHVPAVVTRTIALAITTIWNFYLYKTRIFNQSGKELIG